MTDNELAVAAKTDQHAFAELTVRYADMVGVLASRRYAAGLDRADMKQIATIALWGAVRTFDPDRGHFPSLANLAIRRHLDTAVKTALRAKHEMLNTALRVAKAEDSHDEVQAIDLVAIEGADPLAILIDREKFRTIIDVVLNDCSDLERDVAVGQMDGETYLETAMRLGLSHSIHPDGRARSKPVDNALGRVKEKVQRALREAA